MSAAVLSAPRHVRWRSISLLCLGTLLTGTAINIHLTVVPPHAMSLGTSLVLVGVISGAFGITSFMMRTPAGL